MNNFKKNKVVIGIVMSLCLLGGFQFNTSSKNNIPTIDMGNIHDKSSYKINPWSHDTTLDFPNNYIHGHFTFPAWWSIESYADSGQTETENDAIYYDNHNTKNFLMFSFFENYMFIHIACVIAGPGDSFDNRCFKYFLMVDDVRMSNPKSNKWVMVRSEITWCKETYLGIRFTADHQVGLVFDNQIQFLYEF